MSRTAYPLLKHSITYRSIGCVGVLGVSTSFKLCSAQCFAERLLCPNQMLLPSRLLFPSLLSSSTACLEEWVVTSEHEQVQGKIPVIRFEMNEAYKYMIQVLGRKERIPRRFGDVKEEAGEILVCLKLRYREGHSKDFASLLTWQSTVCKDDQEVWGDWREKSAARRVRLLSRRICVCLTIRGWCNESWQGMTGMKVTMPV